jgi:CubicO group peptidase (beta-lactamase class C family)
MAERLEWFAHRTLFGPLGVTDYNWFLDPTGTPYLGGGIYLRPRDVLKLGQLYLDGGVWKGERLLPESWVRESWRAYGRLAPFEINGHEYGYLWWHHRYDLEGRTVGTLEARGYGGQYLFVVPELDLVAVVTAGNFRNRRTRQSEQILGRFILPAVR